MLRWLADEDFKALVQEYRDRPDQDEPKDLASLVELAHAQLKESLIGKGNISASQAKIALDVLKAAAVVERSAGIAGASSLAARLAELTDRTQSD